jgi:hypothetical protein
MNEFKERCVELRQKDYTLIEIARALGRSKTSVFFHIKGMPLSTGKQKAIRRASGRRLAAEAQKRKGKSVRSHQYITQWNKDLVSLAAHFIFDGEINKRGCVYNNRSNALHKVLESRMKALYAYEPKRYRDMQSGVIRSGYFNVSLAAHFKEKTKELLRVIQDLPTADKKAFLQAFFDDEGCIDFRPEASSRRVRGYQKDASILRLIKVLLNDFDIKAYLQKPNEIVISGKENLKRFEREINFSPGVYMNGRRTNSTWKKDMEKRLLLRAAVQSYK